MLDLYPEEIDPLTKSILKLSGAKDLSKQMDYAEAATVPWMRKGQSSSFFKRKQKARAKLLDMEEDQFKPVALGSATDVIHPKKKKPKKKDKS